MSRHFTLRNTEVIMDIKSLSRIFVIIVLFAIFFFICAKPSFDNWQSKDVVIKESHEDHFIAPGLTICIVRMN